MERSTREPARHRNFSLAFERMCNFVAIAKTRDADETLRQLILQCFVIFPDERFQNIRQIVETIDVLFGLQISEHWAQSILDRLIEDGLVQCPSGTNYILRAETQSELQARIDEAMSLEESVKHEWFEEIVPKFPTLPTEHAWTILRGYLAKAFHRHGIQTAALLDPSLDIAPEYAESLSSLLKDSIRDVVPREQRTMAKEAVSLFLANVGKYPNRAIYITQLGDGAFNYFSLTVAPDTAEQFRKRLQPLTLLLDTNFLFGILDLHVNPQIEVSNELLHATEKYNFPFHLRYHEATEQEMQSTIGYYRDLLGSRTWNRGLSRAAAAARSISGIEAKYHEMNAEKGIDVDTFFKLFEHTDMLLKGKNILIYEEDAHQQEGITDLVGQYQRFLSERGKDKPEKIIEHDMTVLNTVRGLRSDVKTSIEAGALLITCDYLLYRFDWETSRQKDRLACVVIPNLFWQILRPFVPSDSDFDRSFAETFALPEFRTIGSGASKASSKLLCMLALYKDIPEETAARLLSNDLLIDGLRKIEGDKEIQEYIESAMVADNAILIEEKAVLAKQLEIERTQRESKEREFEQEIIRIQQDLRQKDEELGSLEKERKRAERYANILGWVVGIMLVGLFEYTIHKLPWHWLIAHQNSYGLQGAFDLLIVLLSLGYFRPRWRKWLWGSSVLTGIIFLILALLGGPKK